MQEEDLCKLAPCTCGSDRHWKRFGHLFKAPKPHNNDCHARLRPRIKKYFEQMAMSEMSRYWRDQRAKPAEKYVRTLQREIDNLCNNRQCESTLRFSMRALSGKIDEWRAKQGV